MLEKVTFWKETIVRKMREGQKLKGKGELKNVVALVWYGNMK